MIVHYPSLPQKGDILPRLWAALRADDPPTWVFGNSDPPTLTEFIVGFSAPDCHLFLILTPDAQDFVAMLWIDEIMWGQRARGHFYFFKRYRRSKASGGLRYCRQMLHIIANPPFDLKTLLFFTDCRAKPALHVAKRVGAFYVGAIPGYYPGGHPVYVGYLDLEGLYHGNVRSDDRRNGSDRGIHGQSVSGDCPPQEPPA